MSDQQPRYFAEETARRGDDIYERTIRAQVETTHDGKVVAIDVETSGYFPTSKIRFCELLSIQPASAYASSASAYMYGYLRAKVSIGIS